MQFRIPHSAFRTLNVTHPPLVPVLVGPTGVGKTAVAAAWAEREPITVISADARQVYRRLDVGTAKPDRALLARVPHLGIDLVEPGERYSAGRFAREASGWLAAVRGEGRHPLVVGGTGFYIRALAEGLFREPPLDLVRREQLAAWTTRMPVAQLAHWAARLDRRFGGGGRQRATRVLEVALLTGRSLSWWQREARETGVMRPWYIHLTLPRDALQRRIADRVDRMLAAGLVDEVRHVLAQGVPPRAPGLDGVGYREVVAVIEGRLPASDLPGAILVATRRYAKRQETWFRNQLRGGVGGEGEGSVWTLDAMEEPEVLAARIRERWYAATRPSSPVPSPLRT
ncbi:MAG TPA: tRNA (adenosine(37)-N6)-dimethylallyltransferase MiaA [Candidatus Thermoplasmatota archaeon]|nr:tRNA (adenosine(37)-N6)-dimethylallyltransferase MiaA [Candidatus Thermoplasmatota archaeon]